MSKTLEELGYEKEEIDLYNCCYMTHDDFRLQDTLYDLITAGIVVKE